MDTYRSGGWNISPMKKGYESWVCLAWRKESFEKTLLWSFNT